MSRSSNVVPWWVQDTVTSLVVEHGFGAHDVLFDPMHGHYELLISGCCLYDSITSAWKEMNTDGCWQLARDRVFAATKYNGNATDVMSILSM